MADTRILVIDDEKPICEFCAIALERIPNVAVTTEHKAKSALKQCESGKFDLVLTDLNMPETSGVEILKRVKEYNPHTPVVVMTGYPSVDNSVEYLRLGASDYVLKPLLLEDLLSTVNRILDDQRLQEENRLLRRQL